MILVLEEEMSLVNQLKIHQVQQLNHVKDHAKKPITREIIFVTMETTIVDVNMMVGIVVILMPINYIAQNVNV